MRNESIQALVDYAERTGLIDGADRVWAVNRLLEVLHADTYTPPKQAASGSLADILRDLCDYALETGALEQDSVVYRDLFDTKLMGALTPMPSQVHSNFIFLYNQDPKRATDWFYQFSQNTNYIRRDRIAKDVKWIAPTEYGDLDITINLSKPEKDPKAIAAAKLMPQSSYPKCLLCKENEGYAGRVNHPARQNHRVIPVTINGSRWFMQYSPYVYYNEHCIVFNSQHTPMKIEPATFRKLLDFVKQFPHYFVGSNADLPIVGGSILAHDHFQGGHYTFAMERAPIETELTFDGFDGIEAGIVKWPMSVIRLSSADDKQLVELASALLRRMTSSLSSWHPRFSPHGADIPTKTHLSLRRPTVNRTTPSRRLPVCETGNSSWIWFCAIISRPRNIRSASIIRTRSCITSRKKISA